MIDYLAIMESDFLTDYPPAGCTPDQLAKRVVSLTAFTRLLTII